MKYLEKYNDFKLSQKSVNEFKNPFVADKYEDLKSNINSELKRDYPLCDMHAYYITKNPNEDRVAVVIRKIDIMPYNQEYIDVLSTKDYSMYIDNKDRYNVAFNEMIDDISNIIVLNGLKVFDITLSPICKSDLEVKITSNNFK